LQLLLDDGNEHVDGHGAPNLRFDCVLTGAQKLLDAQVLLDPFEEQLDLPTVFVQGSDAQSWQRHVVGQKNKGLSRTRVVELDAPQVSGVVLACIVPIECDGLIADKARGPVHGGRVHTPGVHVALGSGDKEGGALMQGVQAREVQITPVQDVKGPRLDGQQVQHLHIVHLAVADVDEGWDGAAQVQQGVHLHGGLGGAKRCPVEQAQTQVDGGRVQCVHSVLEFEPEVFVQVKLARSSNQHGGQVCPDAPVARLVGIGQGRTMRRMSKTHGVKLAGIGPQARFDIAQRLAPSQLGEGHDTELLGTAQTAHTQISPVAGDDARKAGPRHKLHDLCKQGFADIHGRSPRAIVLGSYTGMGKWISNRHQTKMGCRPHGFKASSSIQLI